MPQFNIAEAKARFSELIEKAVLGEEVIVAKDNKPVARIVALRPAHRQPGTAKGQVLYLSPEFDAPLEEFAEYQ
jgi:prevent-host-death family protein